MKVVLSQLNFIIGDLKGNFELIKASYLKHKDSADLISFSELALTGYPPNDLLSRRGFVEKQLEYAEELKMLTAGSNCCLVLGLVRKNPNAGKPLFNSAVVYHRGVQVFATNKLLLPTYNIFDEARYFESGHVTQPTVFTIGVNKIAILICEDCWNDPAYSKTPLYHVDPVNHTLANIKVDFLLTINASPSDIGKSDFRHKMYSELAERYHTPILYVNQCGGNDALIFDGRSFACDELGKVVVDAGVMPEDLCLEFESNAALGSHLLAPAVSHHYSVDKEQDIINHLVIGIRDYVNKNGFKSVVIGESGGIDSALVTCLAVIALGKENVFAVTMPSKYSSEGSVSDSMTLCRNIGVKLYTRPIGEEVAASIEAYQKAFDMPMSRLAIENMQARIRGRVLMEFSNSTGALVLSTGNKSEIACGYFTLYGDSNGGLAVIGDLYKTEVYAISRYINDKIHGEFIIPKAIIDKEPSAELWENQKDTDSLPPYKTLDALLRLFIEGDLLSKEEKDECRNNIDSLSIKEINRILRMTDNCEFKRRQLPPTIRIHKRAWGTGRFMPLAKKLDMNYLSSLPV